MPTELNMADVKAACERRMNALACAVPSGDCEARQLDKDGALVYRFLHLLASEREAKQQPTPVEPAQEDLTWKLLGEDVPPLSKELEDRLVADAERIWLERQAAADERVAVDVTDEEVAKVFRPISHWRTLRHVEEELALLTAQLHKDQRANRELRRRVEELEALVLRMKRVMDGHLIGINCRGPVMQQDDIDMVNTLANKGGQR